MRLYNQPYSWWGWHGWGYQPRPMSIVEIMEAGTMSPRLAALLWLGMERGASVIVASEPSLAGKTTLLTALLSLTSQEAGGYFTRGVDEDFALPPRDGPQPFYLLINEISDHLPVYTWGPYARRAFDLLAQGYSLAATMHADSLAEVIAILEDELRIPRQQIGRVTFMLTLRVLPRGEPFPSSPTHPGQRPFPRRVAEAAFLQPLTGTPAGQREPATRQENGLALHQVANWDPERDSFRDLWEGSREALAQWAGLSPARLDDDLSQREGYLLSLSRQSITDIGAVEEAIARYRREITA
ncbi:MAG TPA: hypothetical protein VJM69_07075 [Dehalococcoidia bacterium]|nr:hypothetical protein [Dehalococcoidia bacterium]